MKHLQDVKMSYLKHLLHAWAIAFVLIVHGLIPCVWENKASDMLCKDRKPFGE
jgi:hypothetical protein